MKIMVTGGTGYVGAYSVKALLDAGHKVRLLVRDPAKAVATLGALGINQVDCVAGDMTDEDSVLKALKGCQAVLHCAAVVSTDRKRADEMLQANPRGAELVVGHAARLGLDPIVYVSSVAAVLAPGATMLTADMPIGPLQSGYAKSKAAAESYVRKLQDKGAPVVITYPGSVTGPAAGQVRGEAAGGIASNLKMGSLPTHDAAWSLIDVRDLGAIHAALMVKDQGPRRFMCGGHYVKMDELAALYEQLTGREIKLMNMSGAMLRGLGMAADAISRIVPFDSVFTHEAMVCYTQSPPTDDSAVRSDLGVRYRQVSQTLREAILALHAAGQITDEQAGKLAKVRRRH